MSSGTTKNSAVGTKIPKTKNRGNDQKAAWLLGICGMGVGPLAIYMLEEGWKIFGWDDAADSPMKNFLDAAGAIFTKNVLEKIDVVGRSSAVKNGNESYEKAKNSGAKILRRGELLAERAAEKKLIAVCGSHGKTTTSGILAQTLFAAGIETSYVLGGLYKDAEIPPAHFSKTTDWLVAEVDESDGTIKNFVPEICVPVNLDWDHPDYYATEADLEKTFRELFERTKRAIVVPAENERLLRLTKNLKIPVFTVGNSGDFSVQVVSASASGTKLEIGGKFPAGTIELPISGTFNVQNALLALAATALVSGKIGVKPLGNFSGIRRRQDVLFSGTNLKIFADYAHHPTEISALLAFLKETEISKIVAVFQPHRFSRTKQYAAEFAKALDLADKIFVLPVYSAGENFVPGGNSDAILNAVPEDKKSRGNADKIYVSKKFEIAGTPEILLEKLRKIVEESEAKNDEIAVAFIGAGNIDKLAAAPFAKEMWLIFSGTKNEIIPENFAEKMRKNLSAKTSFEEEKNLGAMTTIGVGGNAKFFSEPASEKDLQTLLRGARAFEIPVEIFGNGSNLLVPDEGFSGLAIRLSQSCWRKIFRLGNENSKSEDRCKCASNLEIRAFAGAKLKEICTFAARENLGGFEFLEGIPGTLGGALRMNAGAHGNSIFDRISEVELLLFDGTLRKVSREQLSPIYRDCPELHGAIVLSATLKAGGVVPESEILSKQKKFAELRKNSQPRERSAGCTFKNPRGNSAGKIIDELGLKNLEIGGAKISEIHANFITTKKGATAADVEALVRKIRGIVKAETGILLVPEIVCFGRDWNF